MRYVGGWSLALACAALTGCSVLSFQSGANGELQTPSVSCATTQLGSGTLADPYLVCSPAQLAAASTQALSAHYKLMNDIDMVDYDGSTPAKSISPIGVYDYVTPANTTAFTGSFDGVNHKITNLKMTAVANQSVGLFGSTSHALIQNLKLINVQISGGNYAGSLIGYADSSRVSNVEVTGAMNAGQFVGGLVGYNYASGAGADGSIDNVTSSVVMTVTDCAGGLIGYSMLISGSHAAYSRLTFNGTMQQGPSSGNTYGGIIGLFNTNTASSATLTSALSSAPMSFATFGSFTGGLIGTVSLADTGSSLVISKVAATGSIVTADAFTFVPLGVGGLIGSASIADGVVFKLQKAGFQGSVTISNAGITVGGISGLVGWLNTNGASNTVEISDSYAIGAIAIQNPSANSVGGLFGNLDYGSSGGGTIWARNYSGMTMTGLSDFGNIAGAVNYSSPVMTSTYFNSVNGFGATSAASAQPMTGVTGTADLIHASTFSGFDFTNVWSIAEGVSSPRLR